MTNLKNYGRIFYGIGIAGIGILHFFYKGFRPIIMPVPAESVENISILIYLIALYILVSGILVSVGKNIRNVSLILGVVFFLFLIAGHLPQRLQYHPEILGRWTDTIKLLALSGGAFIMASAFPQSAPHRFFDSLNKVAPMGTYFFASMLCLFGYGHFASAQGISTIVPGYIPWPLFWTYIAGVALVGSGIAIFINFKVKWIALLLGITLFLWLILLHLYYAIRFPDFRDGENIVGSFQCLAFCGIALVLSGISAGKKDTSMT